MNSPNTTRCPHCGRELKPLTVEFAGVEHVIGRESCDCDASQAERAARTAIEDADRGRREAEARRLRYLEAGIYRSFLPVYDPAAAPIVRDASAGVGSYIFGPSGTGKTRLASSAAKMLIDSGMQVRFVNCADFMLALREGWSRQAEKMRRLSGCGVLFIDDLGAENSTPESIAALYVLIDRRWRDAMPTVITTNYTRRELAKRLAEKGSPVDSRRIMSRLSDPTRYARIELSGEDRRLHA